MRRHLILISGLVALALAFGPAARPTRAADAPRAATAETKGGAHAEGGEGEPNILEPQAPLAIWTVVVFIGLLVVLGLFAWKPLLQALHQREEHLEHCLLETERARNE